NSRDPTPKPPTPIVRRLPPGKSPPWLGAQLNGGPSTRAGTSARMEKNCGYFPLGLLSLLVYQLNELFAEALVSTGDLEDLGIAFFGESFFCKCPLHL